MNRFKNVWHLRERGGERKRDIEGDKEMERRREGERDRKKERKGEGYIYI